MLNSYLYLNDDIIDEFISAIDGYVADEVEEIETSSLNNVKGAKINAKILTAGANSEKNIETVTTKTLIKTPSAKCEKIIKYLKEKNELEYYEQMNVECFNKIQRGNFLELTGIIRYNRLKDLENKIRSFDNINTVFSLSGANIIDEKTKKDLQMIKQITDLSKNKLACVLNFNGEKSFSVITNLDEKFLKNKDEEFNGEVTLLCKVQRKIQSNEKYELTDIVEQFKNLTKDKIQQKKLDKELITPAEFKDTIIGPAFIVLPIAIYR